MICLLKINCIIYNNVEGKNINMFVIEDFFEYEM